MTSKTVFNLSNSEFEINFLLVSLDGCKFGYFIGLHFQFTNLSRNNHQCSSVDTCKPIDQASLHCDKTYYMVATLLWLNPGTIPRRKMEAGTRAWFSTGNHLYHKEPNTGPTESTDLRRSFCSVLHHTSNTVAFEMIWNSLR